MAIVRVDCPDGYFVQMRFLPRWVYCRLDPTGQRLLPSYTSSLLSSSYHIFLPHFHSPHPFSPGTLLTAHALKPTGSQRHVCTTSSSRSTRSKHFSGHPISCRCVCAAWWAGLGCFGMLLLAGAEAAESCCCKNACFAKCAVVCFCMHAALLHSSSGRCAVMQEQVHRV